MAGLEARQELYGVPDLPRVEEKRIVALLLHGGRYHEHGTLLEVPTYWPPPLRIWIGHRLGDPGGDVYVTDEKPEPELGVEYVEYERASYGFVCEGLAAFGGYFPADWPVERRIRIARHALGQLSRRERGALAA